MKAAVVRERSGPFVVEELRDPDDEDPADRGAREAGLTFIKLDGTIGCMVNGAGLAMTTMDLVKRAGGEPANFLDIGGGARADKVAAAMRIILADPKVDAILVNIFGGITRGDEVARGLAPRGAAPGRAAPARAAPAPDQGPVPTDLVQHKRRHSPTPHASPSERAPKVGARLLCRSATRRRSQPRLREAFGAAWRQP